MTEATTLDRFREIFMTGGVHLNTCRVGYQAAISSILTDLVEGDLVETAKHRKSLIDFLDMTEQSDSGRDFHPVTITGPTDLVNELKLILAFWKEELES